MAAEYPTLATAAGTTFSITTTAPANHDQAGFTGIASGSWTEVGAIVNTGGFPKTMRQFTDVDLLSGVSLVIPTTEQMDTLTIEAVYQGSDAGQQAVAAASDGKTIVWGRWVTPGGLSVYAAGYITGYGPSANTSQDYVGTTFMFKPIFDVNKVGPVRVQASGS